jgi:hypothetical protein
MRMSGKYIQLPNGTDVKVDAFYPEDMDSMLTLGRLQEVATNYIFQKSSYPFILATAGEFTGD